MSDGKEPNEWFCEGAKWARKGMEMSDGLTGLAVSGCNKQDIFAFVRGFRSAKPTPPQPEKEDVK